jgi:hypothetical protein
MDESVGTLVRPAHQQVARRGNHRSTKELKTSIDEWIERWNANPKPFVWHKSADEILDSLAAYCTRISEPTH